MTTTDGNLVAAGDLGQIVTVLEMLTGQFFLVTRSPGWSACGAPARGQDRAAASDDRPS